MAYEPLHHKYRPQTFAELVGQEAIATTLTNALRQRKIAPAYLFTGARGTGKTSSARILAKSLNCLSSTVPTEKPCGVCEVCRAIANGSALDVIEIDAASNTGVDNIRELIERSQFAPVQCRYKVYVIDECHMLSTAAFNALLKTLEEPPDRIVFILATTDPQRVLPTIISRCQRFDFRRIPLEAMVKHLIQIAAKEAIAISPDAIQLIAQISQGGLRDAESLLDQLSLLDGQVTVDRVWDLVGAVPERDLLMLVQAIAADSATTVLEQARRLMDRGREPLTVLQNLASFYRDLLIAKTTPDRQDLVAITPPTWAELCQLAQPLNIRTILTGQQQLRESEIQVRNTTQPRLWLEVTLMGLLPSALLPRDEQQVFFQLAQPAQRTPQPPKPDVPAAPSVKQPDLTAEVTAVPAANGQSQTNGTNGKSDRPTSIEAPQPSELPQPAKPEEQRTTPDPSPSTDLIQIWNKLVANLHPPGTQMLLRQQAWLLAFNGQQARVGIRSQPLFKMAQQRLPNIETAFETIYGHRISVSLEVATEPKSSEDGLSQPDSAPLPAIPQKLAPEAAKPATEAPYSLPPQASPVVSEAADTPAWQDEDEVSRAAKSVAQLFNGQIVSAEDSVQPLPETVVLSSDSTFSEPETDLDSEDDVPF